MRSPEVEGVSSGPVVPAAGIDAVVGHHLDPSRSGVSRFNQILAEHLGVPVVGILEERIAALACPLLSFKFSELAGDEIERLAASLHARGERPLQLFLHDFAAVPLERDLIERARRVFCGNHEIQEQVAQLTTRHELAWAPGLVLDTRRFEPASISVFSFGMAHKVRTDMFRKLHRLLEDSGESYCLYVSNANHETATLEDAQLVYEEMRSIFPSRLYFMGNLSDVAVYNHLLDTTFFAAFFRNGARANNTSLASAMEHGAVIVTNLDEHSPPYLRHMETVVDINRCDALPRDPLVLKRISVGAMEAARDLGWDSLAVRVREP